jgi:hypothetical protein
MNTFARTTTKIPSTCSGASASSPLVQRRAVRSYTRSYGRGEDLQIGWSATLDKVISVVRLALRGAFAVVTLTVLSGCGIVTWQGVYCSNQTHGNARVCVEQKCGLGDCSLRIVVAQGSRHEQIAYRRGCVLNFAEAYWTGSVVATFVDGGYCQQMKAAYDVALQRTVPVSTFEPGLRSAIVEDYRVDSSELRAAGGDVFRWATYPGDGNPRRSTDEFARRYPH